MACLVVFLSFLNIVYWQKTVYLHEKNYIGKMIEEVLHYVWKHKILPLKDIKTVDGKSVEVINPGMHNHDAGPDFIGAKVKIDGLLWAGNVEIHLRASDWFRHKHDANPAYNSVILHVATDVDTSLSYPSGEEVPQVEIEVPSYILDNYESLMKADTCPPCKSILPSIHKLKVHGWLSALQVERLEMRTSQIMERRERLDKNWEDTLFVTVARSFGFGKNGDAFEQWANNVPMSAVGKHRDDLFQIKAIFLGQAGMLGGEGLSGIDESEYDKLSREYTYLKTKFSLTPIDKNVWKYFRLRPQNFPHVRIVQLAHLYYDESFRLSNILNAQSLEDYLRLFDSKSGKFKLSNASKLSILINSVSPILFAYGSYRCDEEQKDKAIELLEKMKPEDNAIIRDWLEAGIVAEHSADTQALIHLTKTYCEKRDCTRCRFGHEYLSRNPGWLREEG